MEEIGSARELVLPGEVYDRIVAHAQRKLDGTYRHDEEPEKKAYGLVGGRCRGRGIDVTHAIPLHRNLRWSPHYQGYMDAVMETNAVPSETPFERRGWVADPAEVRSAEETCQGAGATLVGSYHMHRVPWEGDPRRDTCTELDRRLAEGSGLWVLILSMTDPTRPILRAFFEGRNDVEATVRPTAGVGMPDAS
jgi:hypothetical protein